MTKLIALVAARLFAAGTMFAGEHGDCVEKVGNEEKAACQASMATLNLTADQKTKMDAVMADHHKAGCSEESEAKYDPVEMAAKMFQTLGFCVEIEEVLHPDGRVLVFHIPSRPRGTAYDFEGAYLMRAGEALVPMSEDRLRAIFAEGQPDWLSQPALTDCDDDKVVQLLDTQSYFDLLHLPIQQIGPGCWSDWRARGSSAVTAPGGRSRIWAEFCSRRS